MSYIYNGSIEARRDVMGGRKAEDKTAMAAQAAGAQFTYFTSTKVQILTL